uniref:Uncharacterized protein n=1 Tax=Octopus bimaculoides TaxID=37653 RepID=A0A0L8HAS6_OCTBM
MSGILSNERIKTNIKYLERGGGTERDTYIQRKGEKQEGRGKARKNYSHTRPSYCCVKIFYQSGHLRGSVGFL